MDLLVKGSNAHAGLYDVCEWFIEKYPEDIFQSVKEINDIRAACKAILSKRKNKAIRIKCSLYDEGDEGCVCWLENVCNGGIIEFKLGDRFSLEGDANER